MSNIGKTYKCSICGSSDHTKRTHDKPVTVAAVIASEPTRKCSHCGIAGHYARTCRQSLASDAGRGAAYVAYLGYVRSFTADAVAMRRDSKAMLAASIMGRPVNVQIAGVGVY